MQRVSEASEENMPLFISFSLQFSATFHEVLLVISNVEGNESIDKFGTSERSERGKIYHFLFHFRYILHPKIWENVYQS